MNNLISYNKIKNTGVIYYSKTKTIRKFVLKKKYCKLIKNEEKGLNWYTSKNYKQNKNIVRKITKEYIDMKFINGKQIKFWDKLEINYKYAKQVIKHYISVWPKKKFTHFHGDLTFSNIIFTNKKSLQIIDWENFSKKKLNWGYDLAYFLISTVALPSIYQNNKKIKNSELVLLKKLWRIAFKNKKFNYLNNPIKFLKKNFNKTFLFRKYNDYYPNLLSRKKIQQIEQFLGAN